ncbi:MAG TPA: phosphoglucomutase/phosphomannomutase family protein [Terriglobia bacterium]|nr:phosphoglucomutase/phosphomannomutase family protein [Terriglobia bacterium]
MPAPVNAAERNPIKFGTSGWRGIIAEDFTFQNVRLAAAGIGHYLLTRSGRPRVVLGYDTRFLSERFAAAAADVLNSHGVETDLAERPDPTPALAYEIIHRGLDGGVNITASHNPAEYNGVKFSGADGAPALPEVTREIEGFIGKVLAGEYSLQGPMFAAPLRHSTDPRPSYLAALREKVDFGAIAGAKLRIAYDPLYGTGRGYLNDLLREAGAEVHTLHDYRDVLFSGVGSEPSEKNLSELAQFVKEKQCAVGLATDGDADRFGIVDSDGTWIHPNYVLAVLGDYLIEARRIPGGLGRSVATTHLLDAIAEHHRVPLYQTPVGFKYIGELIKRDLVALGGEESAGLSIRGHLPEKDGILAGLLVAEAVARRGQSVKQQIEALYRKVGPRYSTRINLALQPAVQKRLLEKLSRDWEHFDAKKIARLDRTDGLKMIREDGSWVLMRLSGTEPLVRIYCEAPSPTELDSLVKSARTFVLEK